MQNREKLEHFTKMMEEILIHLKQQLIMLKDFNINKINRKEAIAEICKKQLFFLNAEERSSYLLDWWVIDENDIEFSSLSSKLQSQILENTDPPKDSENCIYDELILIALKAHFKGVTNAFVAKSMIALGLGIYEVYGDIEKLEVCPCCNYRTLNSRGNYDICELCYWEDCGIERDEQYSSPNHMTLGEAKKKFIENIEDFPLHKWEKA